MTLYLDSETTGLNPGHDEVLQIGIVDDTGAVRLDTLVRPTHRTIWPDAEAIHGITPAMVANAPPLDAVLPHLVELVRGEHVVIYNAAFDCGFLPVIHEVAAQVSCAMLAFAEHYGDWNDYYGDYRWQTLITAADYVWHDYKNAHDAVSDALACRAVHRYLADQLERQRVDAVREQARLEREAKARARRIAHEVEWALLSIEGKEAEARKQARQAFEAALWQRLKLRPEERRGWRSWREHDARCDEYCRLFCGVPLEVAEYEKLLGRALPAYTRRADVPAHLKAMNAFRGELPWIRKELMREAYLMTPKSFSWLYDEAQVAKIRARHPLRQHYVAPPGRRLVTTTQLRRELRLKDEQIAALTPVIEIESHYHGWIFMYEVDAPSAS